MPYCHMAPSFTVTHLITKFCGQSGFSLTLASLQQWKLLTTSPWHILSCAVSRVILSNFSPSLSLPGLFVDVFFSTHSNFGIPQGSVPAPFTLRSPKLPIWSPARVPKHDLQYPLIWLWVSSCQERTWGSHRCFQLNKSTTKPCASFCSFYTWG